MGRAPCCDKANVKKGPWSPEEDSQLKEYIEKYGTGGNWIALPQKAGLRRCGKSCRLRWLNYLRPNIKHGEFSAEEDRIICTLYATIGSRWSIIAAQMPGRTDNDIKNYWNTKLKKKLIGMVSSTTTPHIRKPQSFHSPHQNSSFQRLSSLNKSDSSDSNNLFKPTTDTYSYDPSNNISIPINYSNTINSCLVTNPFESQSMDQFYPTLKGNHNLPVEQGSCSSFFHNGLEENYQKMTQNDNNINRNDFGKDIMNYDMEDVKELISSSSSSSGFLSMNLKEDQNKRRSVEEKYYYYY